MPTALRDTVKAVVAAVVPLEIQSRLIRKDISRPVELWDREFSSGAWRHLESAAEMPRYAVIAGYFQQAANGPAGNGAVLDVGCGAGLLQPWLRRVGYSGYVGVDLSAAAIEQARRYADATTQFKSGNAVTYEPDQAFDMIVFNEMLYYMPDPVATLRRYARYLTPTGSYVISMWRSRDGLNAWRRSRGALAVLDKTRIRHSGTEWNVRLCRPN